MESWIVAVVIGGFFLFLLFIVMLLASVSRRLDLRSDYHNPTLPDAKHPVLPPMPNVNNSSVRAHVSKPRRGDNTMTRSIPKPAAVNPAAGEAAEMPRHPGKTVQEPSHRIQPEPDTPLLRPSPQPSVRKPEPKRPPAPDVDDTPYEVRPRAPKQQTVAPAQDDSRYSAAIPSSVMNSAAREMAAAGINYDAAKMILTVFCRIRNLDEIPPVMLQEFNRIGMDRAVMSELLSLAYAARSSSTFNFASLQTLKPQTGFAIYRSMQKVTAAMREE
ncbi:MAG: hypothetical protein HPZ91_15775 [Lentisphaeria bacterium]|nr:hypothetical protein [Lentisphaeria bacterium]